MLAEGLVALWGRRSGLVSDCLLGPQWEAQLELEMDWQLLEDLLANSMGRWSGSMLAEGLVALWEIVSG